MIIKSSKTTDGEWAIKVNERTISREELEKSYSYHISIHGAIKDRKTFIEELITKELLIQEAKKMGLDNEEPFRRSIQNYYEQTLIRNLTQKLVSGIKVSVSEDEVISVCKETGLSPDESTKADIRTALEEKKRQDEMEDWLKSLKDKALIKIKEDIKTEEK
jgi:hypothetical protein